VGSDLSVLTISATKPNGQPAAMLSEMGVNIVPVEEEDNVDRYIISKRLAIERWTGSGFLQGIVDRTLFTSAIYLSENFSNPIMIIEGEVSYECRGINPQAVRGALGRLILLHGVNVLSTPDVEETVNLMAMLARQEHEGIPEMSLIPKRKAIDLPDMQRRVVEMLPGCGMVIARDLLQSFGSIRRIATATEEEFRSLPGVGVKKAAEMYSTLNAEYESVDTEKNLEDAIEAVPELLFSQPITMIDRQHYICTEGKERHIVDMVFLDPAEDELILVELKRGKLLEEHYGQIRRYLDNAYKSQLLLSYLEKGMAIRGVLATVEDCEFEPEAGDVSVCIVDKKRAIEVVKKLRRRFPENGENHGDTEARRGGGTGG
jgi:DNA excision repair protein ERCC-4